MKWKDIFQLQKKTNPKQFDDIRNALRSDLVEAIERGRGAPIGSTAKRQGEVAARLLATDQMWKRGISGQRLDLIINNATRKAVGEGGLTRSNLQVANFDTITRRLKAKTLSTARKDELFVQGFEPGELEAIIDFTERTSRLARLPQNRMGVSKVLRDTIGPLVTFGTGVAAATTHIPYLQWATAGLAATGVMAQAPRVLSVIMVSPNARRLALAYLESPGGLSVKRAAALATLVRTGNLPKDAEIPDQPSSPQSKFTGGGGALF